MAVWIKTLDGSLVEVEKIRAENYSFLNREIKKGYGNTKKRAINLPVDNNMLNLIAEYVRIHKTFSDQENDNIFDEFTNNIHPHMLIRLALAARRIELIELYDVVMRALARMDEITVVSQIAELNEEEKMEILKIHEDPRDVDELTAFIEGGEKKDGNQSGSSKSRNKRKKSKRAQKKKKKKELAEGGDNDQHIVNDHDDHDADSKGSRPSKSKLNNMKKKERRLSKKGNDSVNDRVVLAFMRNLSLTTEKRLKEM